MHRAFLCFPGFLFQAMGSRLAYFHSVTFQVLPFPRLLSCLPPAGSASVPLPVTPITLGTNLASTALSPVQRGGSLPRGWPVRRSGPEAHQAQGLCQGPPQHFHAPSWLEHSHPLEVEVTPFTDGKVNLGVNLGI